MERLGQSFICVVVKLSVRLRLIASLLDRNDIEQSVVSKLKMSLN